MLIKEYRIPLPLSVEEYKIAQLYMIAKKSREETKDTGSGVEILVNEPYSSGPGGSGGQYTKKIYHVGNHLPNWFKSLLPKSALSVEEEAWNAYPYTKTRYTCPFVEKFFIEIETVYRSDYGNQPNVFNLSGSDLRNRGVDLIDIVKDAGVEQIKEEDPTIFVSRKTGRGPLNMDWLDCYKQDSPTSSPENQIMCAYKLCRVEFRYWGMQTKLEKYIHDFALRKTMVRAHRQAWAWQDEWFGLNMDDIRRIEKETQEALRQKMGFQNLYNENNESSDGSPAITSKSNEDNNTAVSHASSSNPLVITLGSIEKSEHDLDDSPTPNKKISTDSLTQLTDAEQRNNSTSWSVRKHKFPPDVSSSASSQDDWQINALVADSDSECSDSEFFDCEETILEHGLLVKWSSLDLINNDDLDYCPSAGLDKEHLTHSADYINECKSSRPSAESSSHEKSTRPSLCKTAALLLVFHSGNILDTGTDFTAKRSDIMTLRTCFENVMRQHYPGLIGRLAIKLVPCPLINTASLSVLSSLSPYSFDVSPSSTDAPHITHDSIPIGVIPIFSTMSQHYKQAVYKTVSTANNVYHEFTKSRDGVGFNGTICILGDSLGSILAYDALICDKNDNVDVPPQVSEKPTENQSSVPNKNPSGSGSSLSKLKLEFEVQDLYMFGSPLSLVLTYRNISHGGGEHRIGDGIRKPNVQQVYNLFHPTDPMASRLEPLISTKFSMLPPVNIPRYQKYPLGNSHTFNLLEVVQANTQLFMEEDFSGLPLTSIGNSIAYRRISEGSLLSNSSGLLEHIPDQVIKTLTQKWFGDKRLDYALYCPEGLTNFPVNALPHLFHASYWESFDVIAFLLRQIVGGDVVPVDGNANQDISFFKLSEPCEKWIRKRTSVKLNKLKNIAANHRANDVIVKEGLKQSLVARFMYGLYDVITLTGEKVDIYVMNNFSTGEWIHLSTQVTDKTGRIFYTIPDDKALSYGIHNVKMIVRGDHTSVDFRLAVIPPKTECVVFSVDGSFTASVSVTGRDPKVRPGAVDIVRHWMELGYLIIYISARPDMQQQIVLSWLSQHNFPHGLMIFADRFSTDPLGYKTAYLKNLVQEHDAVICSAYGSNKDINVYSSIGLKPSQVFIVGRVSRKYQLQATILSDGYVAHLTTLTSCNGPRPAQGNARMVLIPRGCFGQNASIKKRRPAKRSTSFPLRGAIPSSSISPKTTATCMKHVEME